MEEKKKKGMSSAQLEEYERRKSAWKVREKERVEKESREREEQKAKIKKQMDAEMK